MAPSARTCTAAVAGKHGVGLVELLIALAIGGIILGVTAAFYGQQTRVTRETQARNDANLRARGVLEAVVQDVRMAGARAAVDGVGRTAFRRRLPCDAGDTCIAVVRAVGENGVADGDVLQLQVQYVSSLYLGDEGVSSVDSEGIVAGICRTVTYELDGTTLYRSDVDCGDPPLATGFATEFARNVVTIDVAFLCADAAEPDATVGNPSMCFSDVDGFMREARVDVVVDSARDPNLSVALSSATTTPNLRSFDRFVDPDAEEDAGT